MRIFFPHRWIQVTTTSLLALLMLTELAGCGSGSSSSITPANTQTGASSYWSSVSIGDFGEFNIDLAKGTFVFNFIDSAYGLAGTSIQGTVTADANGTYIGTASSGESFPIVIKESYAIATLPLANAGLTPVIGINKNQAITSASQLLAATAASNGNFLKSIGYSCQTMNQSPYNCIANTSIGLLLPGKTDSEITMYLCDNGGRQDDNSLLIACYNAYVNNLLSSATPQINQPQFNFYLNYLRNNSGTSSSQLPGTITTWTATLNTTTNSWDFVSPSGATIRGVFANDSSSGNLVGFWDTVNVSGTGYSGFKFVSNISQAPSQAQLLPLSAPYPENKIYSNTLIKLNQTETEGGIGNIAPTNYPLQIGGLPFYGSGPTKAICSARPNPYTASYLNYSPDHKLISTFFSADLYINKPINSNQLQTGGPLGGLTPMAGFLSISSGADTVESVIYMPGNDGIGIGFAANSIALNPTPGPTTSVAYANSFKFFYTTSNQGKCY